MNFEVSEQERELLLELVKSAEEVTIQGIDRADSRSYKELLRARLDLLISAEKKLGSDSKRAA
jgi:hypothetical protein